MEIFRNRKKDAQAPKPGVYTADSLTQKKTLLVESFHTHFNTASIPTHEVENEWSSDCTRGASQLSILNQDIFQNSSDTPSIPVNPSVYWFKQMLKSAFRDEQRWDVPDSALNQLIQLSCIKGLSKAMADVGALGTDTTQVKFPQDNCYFSATHSFKVNFSPNITPGVIQISMTCGLTSTSTGRYEPRAHGENKIEIEHTNSEQEPVATCIIEIRGFYCPKQGRFIFPLHWPNLGFATSRITCAINPSPYAKTGNDQACITESETILANFVNNNFWNNHNHKDKKWYLPNHLIKHYQQKIQLTKNRVQQNESKNQAIKCDPQNYVWSYIGLGCTPRPRRTPEKEACHSFLCAQLLWLGEHHYGKALLKQVALNEQMQPSSIDSSVATPQSAHNSDESKLIASLHALESELSRSWENKSNPPPKNPYAEEISRRKNFVGHEVRGERVSPPMSIPQGCSRTDAEKATTLYQLASKVYFSESSTALLKLLTENLDYLYTLRRAEDKSVDLIIKKLVICCMLVKFLQYCEEKKTRTFFSAFYKKTDADSEIIMNFIDSILRTVTTGQELLNILLSAKQLRFHASYVKQAFAPLCEKLNQWGLIPLKTFDFSAYERRQQETPFSEILKRLPSTPVKSPVYWGG